MTIRELLKELQALDEKSLNNQVLVRAHSGGSYYGISQIEVMFVGNVVLRLLEAPPLTEIGKQFEEILTRNP